MASSSCHNARMSQVVRDGIREEIKDKLGDGNDNESNGDSHHQFKD